MESQFTGLHNVDGLFICLFNYLYVHILIFQKNCPNSSSKKAVYEEFLKQRQIDVDSDLTRADLWTVVKQELTADPPCIVDDMAAKRDIRFAFFKTLQYIFLM